MDVRGGFGSATPKYLGAAYVQDAAVGFGLRVSRNVWTAAGASV